MSDDVLCESCKQKPATKITVDDIELCDGCFEAFVQEAIQDQEAAEQVSPQPEEFALVEVFGHRSHAGRVTEVERFGAKLLRVDVPDAGGFEAGYSSHFYGGAALFSFTPTDRATCERLAREKAERDARWGVRPRLAPPDDDDSEALGVDED